MLKLWMKRLGKLAFLAACCAPLAVMINFTVQTERRDRAAWEEYLETQRQIVKALEKSHRLAEERDRIAKEIKALQKRYPEGVKR